jgi:hypothetical protein
MVRGFDLDSKKYNDQFLYPLKNQEDEVIIQLDKINQNQYLLKEMGLTDLEIYQNLQYADFFISINLY